MRRRTGFLAALFGTLAASSWLVYRHGGDGRQGRRTQRIASIVDPALRRADREAAEGTEYVRDWSSALDFDLATIEERERQVEAGNWIPAAEVFRRLRSRTGAGPRRVA